MFNVGDKVVLKSDMEKHFYYGTDKYFECGLNKEMEEEYKKAIDNNGYVTVHLCIGGTFEIEETEKTYFDYDCYWFELYQEKEDCKDKTINTLRELIKTYARDEQTDKEKIEELENELILMKGELIHQKGCKEAYLHQRNEAIRLKNNYYEKIHELRQKLAEQQPSQFAKLIDEAKRAVEMDIKTRLEISRLKDELSDSIPKTAILCALDGAIDICNNHISCAGCRHNVQEENLMECIFRQIKEKFDIL